MKRIFKYKITGETTEITIPDNATILDCQMQVVDEIFTISLWAIVDAREKEVKRRFTIFPTGGDISDTDRKEYIATVQQGSLVWHLFEVSDECDYE